MFYQGPACCKIYISNEKKARISLDTHLMLLGKYIAGFDKGVRTNLHN